MILCPVCGKGNKDLAVTCVECHGYLQSRVDALDLFATIWGMIESPGRTLKKIALATHKNYTLLLASLFGIVWTFLAFRVSQVGTVIPELFSLVLAGLVGGSLVGLVALPLSSSFALWLGRRMGGEGGFRNVLALFAYAAVPLLLALVFVLPVELGVFGVSLFGIPPSPWDLKPGIFLLLCIINGALLLWFLGLLVASLSVGLGLPAGKAAGVGAVIVGWLSALAFVPFLAR